MDAYKSFVAEVIMLSLLPVLFVSRFWILRHQTRALEDWIRDILFAVAILMCMATTSILAWYCWRSVDVYKQAAAIVDQKMEGAVTSSGVDTSKMTTAQLSAFVEKIQAERASKIEGLATMMLLDSWYRRVCCLYSYGLHICAYCCGFYLDAFFHLVFICNRTLATERCLPRFLLETLFEGTGESRLPPVRRDSLLHNHIHHCDYYPLHMVYACSQELDHVA